MRRRQSASEIRKLAKPLAGLLDGAWQRMHWWVGAMAVLYLLSGITIVRPDEVAVVLRWGQLVGSTPALQQHGPGLLFAFPRPMDQVVRVRVKQVNEVPVHALAATDADSEGTLNPLTQGYALTGDQNIVHVDMVARYRVRDPVDWAFYGAKTDVVGVEVTAAMVRSLGEMPVDRVLADGRKTLIATATRRAQAALDAVHSGLELTSLELIRLSPPAALATDFDSVQSAFIGMETRRKESQAYTENAIPQAQARANSVVESAKAAAASELAAANGEASVFRALTQEYHANPMVVRERLYRDAVEKAITNAAGVQWVPPPMGGSYHGFRITVRLGVSPPKNGGAGAVGDDE